MSLVAVKQPYFLQIMQDDEPYNPRTDYDNFGHMMCWHSRYNLGDENEFSQPNDFLQHLVLATVSHDAIIDYAKSGNADNMKMEYNRSMGGWEVSSYNDYFKKWYTDCFYEGKLENNKDDLAISIVESMGNNDLMVLARTKNIILPLNLYDHSGISMSVSSFIGRAQHAEWDSGQVGWIYATPEDIQKEYGNLSAESFEKTENLLTSEVETYNYYLTNQCYGFRLYENGEELDSCWGFLGEFSDMAKEIAQTLPESHRDMVDNLQEVSDTRLKGYEDYMEEMEA